MTEDHSEENENINPSETPRERFRRLATLRVNEVLKRLKILGNCANRRTYEYDQMDITKMFDEIEKKVRDTKTKFFEGKEREFKL